MTVVLIVGGMTQALANCDPATGSCATPTFAPAQGYPSGGSVPAFVVTGDFDGNAYLDLAVTNNSGVVTLLRGLGDGTFQSATTVATGSFGRMAAADLDGDQDLDLAAPSGAALLVLLNDGSGAFTPVGPFPAGPSAAVYSVAVGDVNGDGNPDLVTANGNSPGTVSVLLGNGTGMAFSPPINFTVGASPLHVTVADLNGDQRADLAVANADSSSVSMLLGNGTPSLFSAAVSYGVGTDPRATAVGDFDCDGDLDLAVANGRANNARVLLGNGNGTFLPAVAYSTGASPVAVVVDDFNGDGKLDFVTADADSNRASVLLGVGDGTFQPAVPFGTGAVPFDVVAGDFNGCGPDVVTANRGTNNLSVLLNNCQHASACDDGSVCTIDSCAGWACVHTPVNCDDGNACTDDSCNPATGCTHTNDDTNLCSDQNDCTIDHCSGGVCIAIPVNCDDNNPCTDDACDPAVGCIHFVNSGPCDDGLFCTVGDHCSGGGCVTTPHDCNDSVPCTLDSCDEAADRCVNDVTPCGQPGDVDFCAQPPSQMRAWWPLDETVGPTARESINGNTGTHTNGPTPVTGQVAGALQFDGANDYVNVADNTTLNFGASTGNGGGDLSIDAWIKTTATSGIRTIVDKRSLSPNTTGYTLFLLDGKLAFQLADGAGGGGFCGSSPTDPCRNYVSATVVATGNWVHVAVTVDRDQPTGGRFYVNGAVVGTFDPTTKTGLLTNTTPLTIGRHSDGTSLFPGTIDEVEIFGRELSAEDISRVYSAAARGKCKCVSPPSDIVSWYPADDCLPGDHIGPNNGAWSGQPVCSNGPKVGAGDLAQFMSTPPTFVTVPDNASLNFGTGDFSVDLWIKTGTSGPIIGKGMATGPGWLLSLGASGRLSFTACDTSQCFAGPPSNTSVNSNDWRLVGMSVSRGIGPNPPATVTYYVDGHPDGSFLISSMTSMDSVENMLIGASPGSLAPYFNGEMDEIEIFKRALSAAEMKALYDAGTYGKCKCLDPLPKNMIAWWPLDEQVGPAQDIIGGYTGAWTGSPLPSPSSGYVAGSLSFAATGANYVSVPVPTTSPLNFGTGDFSVDAWVYWLGGPGDQPIVEKPDGAGGWNFVLSQKFVHAHLGGGGASSLGAAPTNTWIHVVLTVEQGANKKIKYYKDGVLQGSAIPAQLYNFGGTSNITVGKRFNGKIDELEIFNRVLQPDEITALYRAGHDGKCKETRPVDAGDIMVEKSLISGTPTAGSYVTFRVIITNNGPNGASSIMVNDLLPPGLIYVSSTLPPGWTYDPATGQIFVPGLPGQSKNDLTITAYLDSCDIVTNCATFVGADTTDTNSANDTACVSIHAATPCGVIRGLKYSDANKNGTRDGVEGVVAGQTIRLKNSSNQITKDVTDGSGQYDFLPLASGPYRVAEELQPGQVMISPSSGSYNLNLGNNGVLNGNDFGNYICPAPVAPTCTKAPKGMIGWWAFDETSGSSAFDIVGGHTAQLVGSPTHDPSGEVAYALGNTSSANHATVANGSPFNFKRTVSGFTIDAWVKRTENTGELWIVDRGHEFHFAANTTAGSPPHLEYSGCGTAFFPSTGLVPLNVWTHLAVTVEPNSASPNYGLRGYLNGVLKVSTGPCNYDMTPLGTTPLGIGGGTFTGPGGVDEVEIFNRALDATEIQSIVAAGPNGKCKPSKCALVKHLNFKDRKNKIVSPLKICNRSGVPDTFHWSLAGLPSGAGCSVNGPTGFSPVAGTTAVLYPGQCATINVTVSRPAGMVSGNTTCYQATVVPHSASACFSCKSKAAVSTKWHGAAQHQFTAVEEVPDGTAKNVTFTVENLHGDTDVVNYQLDALSADSSDPPNQLVRLNGLPPGIPVTGTLNIPIGSSETVPVSVSYDQNDALSFYDLVLTTDQAAFFGTPAVEPLTSVGLMSVSPEELPDPCSTVLPSTDIVLVWTAKTRLTWTGGTCGNVFNLYRGTTTRLTGSDYGSCFDNGLTEPEDFDSSFPPVGSFDFYLVTGANGQGEGSLGTRSNGVVRPNVNACP